MAKKIDAKTINAPRHNPAAKLDEIMTGTTVFNIPFPKDLNALKTMSPIIIKHPYYVEYIHSYGQDSPFFAGLARPNGWSFRRKGECIHSRPAISEARSS
ncbi:MAG: hypothetical protein HW377_956 [Actinobacteria bacterium]|nr:hypothetical protein [Actinomycetota bacterium]